MYQVCKGKYILNVYINNQTKSFYEGDILPDGYIPPDDYIINKIVSIVDETKTNKKAVK